MPTGDYRVQDKKVTPPPRARIDESMEALIHHFKIFTEGFKVARGEAYVADRVARGELGCYMVSDGTGQALPDAHPGSFLREHPVPPPVMLQGGLVADAMATISSVDPVMGESDAHDGTGHLSPRRPRPGPGRDPRPLPRTPGQPSSPSATWPRNQDGWLRPRGHPPRSPPWWG